jgi:hypothetical protein
MRGNGSSWCDILIVYCCLMCSLFCSWIRKLVMFSLLAIALLGVTSAYKVGTGIYDITGPSVEINFMVGLVLCI